MGHQQGAIFVVLVNHLTNFRHMDTQSQQSLAHIIRAQRTALGTLDEGAPLVSLVLYLPTADFSAFYLHLSRQSWSNSSLPLYYQSSVVVLLARGE